MKNDIFSKFSKVLKAKMTRAALEAAHWYVGDPCYIIPDDDWDEFCELTLKGTGGDRKEGGHIDSVIQWRGQEITLWTNGGDGTWTFSNLESANGKNSFGVDAGIFCVINLNALPLYEGDPITSGILFEREPTLYVEDGIVYVNDQHDESVTECPDFRCRRVVTWDEIETCENGSCEGCFSCFDCDCEDEEE